MRHGTRRRRLVAAAAPPPPAIEPTNRPTTTTDARLAVSGIQDIAPSAADTCSPSPKITITDICTPQLIPTLTFVCIHQAGSNVNNNSKMKLHYKHMITYYNLLQNWQKPFIVEIYRNINVSYRPMSAFTTQEIADIFIRCTSFAVCLLPWRTEHVSVGLPDLPYFTGDPVFQTLSPASRGEAAGKNKSPGFC